MKDLENKFFTWFHRTTDELVPHRDVVSYEVRDTTGTDLARALGTATGSSLNGSIVEAIIQERTNDEDH